ncbi:MAG: hypothetical protein ACD_63C00073G0002 [uncultured bacterium]|nr:MAG: hypothetical protein ACD_63C00073G0002 [uncultured bacterium]
MNLDKLEKILSSEPSYRKKQVKDAVFKQLMDDWEQAMTLPPALREKLNRECPLKVLAETFTNKKGDVTKARISQSRKSKTAGRALANHWIETVLMRHKDGRNTVCVSSQIGCSLACGFCATGQMGFVRNLEPMEIVEQVLFFARILKKQSSRVNNVVFMGMGEPFLNFKNVIAAVEILNEKDCLNVGARHISISTVGVPSAILKLAEEKLQINLAVSLHAANDDTRSYLIPANKKYPLKKIFFDVNKYIKLTNRKVMFEYVLIKDVNDSVADAKALAKLIRHPLYFLNLGTYNPTSASFAPSSKRQAEEFKKILKEEKIEFVQRYSFGRDIAAACGQLAGR